MNEKEYPEKIYIENAHFYTCDRDRGYEFFGWSDRPCRKGVQEYVRADLVEKMIKEQNKWNKYPVEKPEKPDWYLVTIKNKLGGTYIDICCFSDSMWYLRDSENRVIAWQEKPEEFKED